MVAVLGAFAVLGHAQQQAPVPESSGKHTVATIAIVDVKPSTKPIMARSQQQSSVQPYDPNEDKIKYPPLAMDSQNACAHGQSCQEKRRWTTSTEKTTSSSVSPVPAPSIMITPLNPGPVAPTPIAPAPGASSPVPPPPYYPTVCTPAPTSTVAPSPPAQPYDCPTGQYPCPHRGNGTTAPPASVTTAGAGYVQPVAGMAMVIAGVFGLLMF